MSLDKILELRLATIEKVLDILYSHVTRYEMKKTTYCDLRLSSSQKL